MSKRKAKELPTFYVPEGVYNKAFEKIEEKINEKKRQTGPNGLRCHQNTYSTFNTNEPTLCVANFLEAAKQAFEDRNFRALYEIVDKGMDVNDSNLATQLYDYLFMAIEMDPKIVNRDQVLINFVSGGILLNSGQEEVKKYIEEAHVLKDRSEEDFQKAAKYEDLKMEDDSDSE